MIAEGGDGRIEAREREGRRAAAHPLATSLQELAQIRVLRQIPPAAGDQARDPAGARYAEPFRDRAQRNQSVLEGDVCDEFPLECPAALRNSLGCRVESLCDRFKAREDASPSRPGHS